MLARTHPRAHAPTPRHTHVACMGAEARLERLRRVAAKGLITTEENRRKRAEIVELL